MSSELNKFSEEQILCDELMGVSSPNLEPLNAIPITSDSETNLPSIEGKKLGVKGGAATPLEDAPDTPHPIGGGSGKVLSGDCIELTQTPKRKRGRPRGSKNKPKVKLVEVVKDEDTSLLSTLPHASTPMEAIAYKKEQAQYALTSGAQLEKKEKRVDEVAIEKDLLSEWLNTKTELELAAFFNCRHYQMWKDEVGMSLPVHAAGKLGYYIAAFNGLRKIGYYWEQLIMTDGNGQWIGVREDLMDAFVGGFLAGIGLSKHMSSLAISRQSVDWGKKELERLAWSQSFTYTDELHQWVAESLHTDSMRCGGYSATSRELFTAYKVTTGDRTLSAIGFGKRLSIALQELYNEECKRGSIRRTDNLRRTTLCPAVRKSSGWMGIKLAISELDELRIKDELAVITPQESESLLKLEESRFKQDSRSRLF